MTDDQPRVVPPSSPPRGDGPLAAVVAVVLVGLVALAMYQRHETEQLERRIDELRTAGGGSTVIVHEPGIDELRARVDAIAQQVGVTVPAPPPGTPTAYVQRAPQRIEEGAAPPTTRGGSPRQR